MDPPLKSMTKPEHFEILDTHAVFRPVGEVSLHDVVRLVTSAIAYAREQHVRKLMVVATGLTGFELPTIAERYNIIQEWGAAAGSGVRAVLVFGPGIIDPQRFGVLVAQNIGFHANVFESEDEALAWLLSD
jgi:CBS domain-containing protein